MKQLIKMEKTFKLHLQRSGFAARDVLNTQSTIIRRSNNLESRLIATAIDAWVVGLWKQNHSLFVNHLENHKAEYDDAPWSFLACVRQHEVMRNWINDCAKLVDEDISKWPNYQRWQEDSEKCLDAFRNLAIEVKCERFSRQLNQINWGDKRIGPR